MQMYRVALKQKERIVSGVWGIIL